MKLERFTNIETVVNGMPSYAIANGGIKRFFELENLEAKINLKLENFLNAIFLNRIWSCKTNEVLTIIDIKMYDDIYYWEIENSQGQHFLYEFGDYDDTWYIDERQKIF